MEEITTSVTSGYIAKYAQLDHSVVKKEIESMEKDFFGSGRHDIEIDQLDYDDDSENAEFIINRAALEELSKRHHGTPLGDKFDRVLCQQEEDFVNHNMQLLDFTLPQSMNNDFSLLQEQQRLTNARNAVIAAYAAYEQFDNTSCFDEKLDDLLKDNIRIAKKILEFEEHKAHWYKPNK